MNVGGGDNNCIQVQFDCGFIDHSSSTYSCICIIACVQESYNIAIRVIAVVHPKKP